MTFLARSLSFSSIRQYVSALNGLLLSRGFVGIDYECQDYKACLAGIRRTLGQQVSQAMPLMPEHLRRMFRNLPMTSDSIAVRAAILLSFRCLLRQNQITGRLNALCRADFSFSKMGLELSVRRSKTIQFRERILSIPVVPLQDVELCAVFWVQKHFLDISAKSTDKAFRVALGDSSMPLSYGIYLSTLRLWAKRAGLVGSVSTHSLRRGGATFFRHCGATIRQIEDRGDWAGDSIFSRVDGRPLVDRYQSSVDFEC